MVDLNGENGSKPVYTDNEPEDAGFSSLIYSWILYANLIFWVVVILIIRGCIS